MLLTSRRMSSKIAQYCACVIFILCLISVGIGQDTSESEEGRKANRTRKLDCMTPNRKRASCLRIKQCDVLLNQVRTNRAAWAYISSSRCSSADEDIKNPLVCCGTDYNFKNISNNADMTTNCVTPNQEAGYCVAIERCKTLAKNLANAHAWRFLLASKCEMKDTSKIHVCCGVYENFYDVLPTQCGREKPLGTRILGGKEAYRRQFPWMAILMHKKGFGSASSGCSGFLIHTKFIITAAHCVNSPYIDEAGPIVTILFGIHGIKEAMDCYDGKQNCSSDIQYHTPAQVITHPKYDRKYNDIALIELKKTVSLSDYVQPICLTKDDSQTPTAYVVCGWGHTENEQRSNVKKYLDIPPFPRNRCIKKYSRTNMIIKDTHICAGGENQRDTCRGDSGGPLMTLSENGTWYASGVVSVGVSCGLEGWPGLYTNIAKFLTWIKSVTAHALATR